MNLYDKHDAPLIVGITGINASDNPAPATQTGSEGFEILQQAGYSDEEIKALESSGILL